MQTQNEQLKQILQSIKARNEQVRQTAREESINEYYRTSMYKIGVKVFTSSYLTNKEKMKGGIK